MASPQLENGFVQIANEVVDRFQAIRLPGQEWQIVWVVIRSTWGWKKKTAHIPLSKFAKETGIDRRKCHTLLKSLVAKKVINRTVTQLGDRKPVIYGINKDFDVWKLTPRTVTVTQKDDRLSPRKVSKLSPKKTPLKEKKEIYKESTPSSPPKNGGPPYQEIISYLNEKSGKNFRFSTKATKRLINARWREGFREEDFRKVIDSRCAKWLKDPERKEYVRPKTLFRGSNFEGYLHSGGHQHEDFRNKDYGKGTPREELPSWCHNEDV